tara:strand:+ start:149 stop:880 length:732 start_codon:yes stop_codon:yes gene_type:complete
MSISELTKTFDHFVIAIDRSSSTYENNISLQIASALYDFADSLTNEISIFNFDTNIFNKNIFINSFELKQFCNDYLYPLPPPPLKNIGRGTDILLALDELLNTIILLKNNNINQRFIGLILTDDEGLKFSKQKVEIINKINSNLKIIKNLNCDITILQFSPTKLNFKLYFLKYINLNFNQIISFYSENNKINEIYRIISNSLKIMNSTDSNKSNNPSEHLYEKLTDKPARSNILKYIFNKCIK